MLCYGGTHEIAPDWDTAQAMCFAVGARLCTVEELEADETRGTGCNFDSSLCWSSDDINCPPGAHVVVGGRSSANVDQSATCQVDMIGAAVRCCADTVVGYTCQDTSPLLSLPCSRCGTFTEFQDCSTAINEGCCGQNDVDDSCVDGVPNSCTEACAAILLPAQVDQRTSWLLVYFPRPHGCLLHSILLPDTRVICFVRVSRALATHSCPTVLCSSQHISR